MTTDKAQRTPYKIPFIIVAVLLLALVVKEGIPYLVKPKLYVVQCTIKGIESKSIEEFAQTRGAKILSFADSTHYVQGSTYQRRKNDNEQQGYTVGDLLAEERSRPSAVTTRKCVFGSFTFESAQEFVAGVRSYYPNTIESCNILPLQ